MKNENSDTNFAIWAANYKFLLIGLGIIVLGFLLMIGGKSEDPNTFNMEIFSAQRIIIAPFVVIFGFAFEIWAIMRKPKEE